jgi:methylation protein EvaC
LNTECRICGGAVQRYLDLGRQPISDAFRKPDDTSEEFFFEIGCNDGVMLRTVSDAGCPHLGVEPSGGVAESARQKGVQVRTDFFEEATAKDIASSHGLADVVYAANTICHIPYLDSVFRGLDALLAPHGVFMFEDPYLGDVIDKTAFDQIYDEHFYLFSARSVSEIARRFGFELVDVRHRPVHGGEVRYTLARTGTREPSDAVHALIAEEQKTTLATLTGFADKTAAIRDALVAELSELRRQGKTVVGYGATAKSATLLNYCRIGPDLVPYICDSTVTKQGLVTPGTRIPIRPPAAFTDPYPDYALLLAWNHAEEIRVKELDFRRQGGRWLTYVPDVHTV